MASCSPPSRTLRAAQARWPSAILDHGCARRLGRGRPGRRNGPFQPNQETSQVGRAVPHGKGSAVASTHAKRRGGQFLIYQAVYTGWVTELAFELLQHIGINVLDVLTGEEGLH